MVKGTVLEIESSGQNYFTTTYQCPLTSFSIQSVTQGDENDLILDAATGSLSIRASVSSYTLTIYVCGGGSTDANDCVASDNLVLSISEMQCD